LPLWLGGCARRGDLANGLDGSQGGSHAIAEGCGGSGHPTQACGLSGCCCGVQDPQNRCCAALLARRLPAVALRWLRRLLVAGGLWRLLLLVLRGLAWGRSPAPGRLGRRGLRRMLLRQLRRLRILAALRCGCRGCARTYVVVALRRLPGCRSGVRRCGTFLLIAASVLDDDFERCLGHGSHLKNRLAARGV
jgi:hypothetical protein